MTEAASAAELRTRRVKMPAEPAHLDLEEAPTDGKPLVLVYANGTEVEAVWRSTRRYNNHRWIAHGFWAIRNAGGVPAPPDPVGWKAAKW